MKIAIAKDGLNVSGHFGHCEGFQVYHLADREIIKREFLANPGHRPGFLPQYLAENGVDVIIAGGMGASAQNLFRTHEIKVIVGANCSLEDAIADYLTGRLTSNNTVCSEHAHHESCGNH